MRIAFIVAPILSRGQPPSKSATRREKREASVVRCIAARYRHNMAAAPCRHRDELSRRIHVAAIDLAPKNVARRQAPLRPLDIIFPPIVRCRWHHAARQRRQCRHRTFDEMDLRIDTGIIDVAMNRLALAWR